MALPFLPATFDVVLCQQGLQFVSDKLGALREMHRVLVPGGRLALSIVRDLQHCPWQRALAASLARQVSAEAAASIREVCALGEADEIRSLLRRAGFRAIHLRIDSKLIRYASLEAFALGYLAASPVARTVATLEDTRRTALLHDLRTALRSYTDDAGSLCPMSPMSWSRRRKPQCAAVWWQRAGRTS
jgi:SAM-dependent methyltransferase